MRRRAMSHNPNRMPRLLREAHKSQVCRTLKNCTMFLENGNFFLDGKKWSSFKAKKA